MTINKAKEGITQGPDMGNRAVMKPGTKPTKTKTPSPKQEIPEPNSAPWKGGIDKFGEGLVS